MEKQISALSTTCKECVFAKYNGNTQVGCELGRIEKIKNHPVYDLIEAYDDDKNFYVLNYHLCLYQRVKGWPHSDEPMDQMIESVNKEIKMNWGAILIFRNEKDSDMSRVAKRLDELFNQANPPKWVGIINNDVEMDVYWVIDYLIKKEVLWYIQSSEENNIRYAIDIILDKVKHKRFSFYAVFESDKEISTDFYNKIHKNILDELVQYSVIKDEDSFHNMVVNKVAHLKFNGNSHNIPLETKIQKEAGEHTLLLQYKSLL